MIFDVEQAVRYKLANAPVSVYPFPHMSISDIFPPGWSGRMRGDLPPLSSYAPLGKGGSVSEGAYEDRYITSVEDLQQVKGGEAIARFWGDLAQWMMGEGFIQFLLQKFAPHAQARFAGKGNFRFRSDFRLIRDLTHYAIGPHTDTPSKVFSLLYYLPKDDRMAHLGTSIYLPEDSGFTCIGGPHYPFEGFRKIYTAPFLPNSLFLFFKTVNSFHGVDKIQDPGIERDVLLYNIYVDPVPEKLQAGKEPI